MDRKITEGNIEEIQYFPPSFVFNRKQGMTLGDIAGVIDNIDNALEKYKDQLPGNFYKNVQREIHVLMMLAIEAVRKHYEYKSMHEIAELMKQLNDITGDEIDRV